MRDRDEIVQTAKAIVKQLQPLTNDDTVELLLQRLTTVVGADGEWTDESTQTKRSTLEVAAFEYKLIREGKHH